MLRNSVLCFLLMAVFSCSQIPISTVETSIIEIDDKVADLNQVLDYVKKIRIIPLETNEKALIGAIVKIIATEELYFVFDFQFSKTVSIYQKNGKWVNTINSKGNGPGEYNRLEDFAIDTFNNEIVLCDPHLKKIIKYDFHGNFKSELHLEFMPISMGIASENSYSFRTMEGKTPTIKTTNREGGGGKVVHTGVFEFNLSTFSHFPIFQGQQLYTEYLNDTIYLIEEDKAVPKYIIDFMENKLTEVNRKELLEMSRKSGRIARAQNSKCGGIVNFLETEDLLLLGCRIKGKSSKVWFNKSNKEKITLQREARGSSPVNQLLFGVLTIDSHNYIGWLGSKVFLDLFNDEEFIKLQERGVIEIESGAFNNQDLLTLNSNPVIVNIEFEFPNY